MLVGVVFGLLVVVGGGVVVVARRRLLVIEVVGDSMAPTYRSGDRLLIHRTRRVGRGDVVIARHQEGRDRSGSREVIESSPGGMGGYVTTWLVKRLVAMPGDRVPESVVPRVGTGGPVPAGMSVLLGDHPESADSKTWGFIPLTDLGGVVVTKLGK